MKDLVVVTGATGTVGRELVSVLSSQGRPVRAAVRRPGAVEFAPYVEVAQFDYADASTHAATFRGAGAVFLVRPPAVSDVRRVMAPAIETAGRQGAHIVTLSVMGAAGNPFVPHHAMEKLVQRTGAPFTHLRPGFFMQNLSTTYRDDIRRGELFLPAGSGRTSFIDVRDIAHVAAAVAGNPLHFGRGYTLTGGEALSYDDAARLLTGVLQRLVLYSDPSPRQFRRRLLSEGHAPDYVRVLSRIYLVARLGLAARVTRDTETLLGRKPITLEQFIIDNADIWSSRATAGV